MIEQLVKCPTCKKDIELVNEYSETITHRYDTTSIYKSYVYWCCFCDTLVIRQGNPDKEGFSEDIYKRDKEVE